MCVKVLSSSLVYVCSASLFGNMSSLCAVTAGSFQSLFIADNRSTTLLSHAFFPVAASHAQTHNTSFSPPGLAHTEFAHEEMHIMYNRLHHLAFPTSDSKSVFAYGFKEDYPENGWEVYDAAAELNRMVRLVCVCAGFSGIWCIMIVVGH